MSNYQSRKAFRKKWALALVSFFSLALAIVIYRYNSGYFTPDERLFIFGFSLHEDLSLKYVISSFFFRALYAAFDVFGIIIFNFFLVSILFLSAYRSQGFQRYDRLSLFILSSLALPQVSFYAATFLRDFHIYLLAMTFLVARIKMSFAAATVSVFLIALLKPELAIIIFVSICCAKVFKNSLWLILLIIACVFLAVLLIYVAPISDVFLDRVSGFENSFLDGKESITLFLVSPFESAPLAVLFLILNFFAFHAPYFVAVDFSPFSLLMFLGNFFYISFVLLSLIGFNKNRFRADSLYRLCFFAFIFSFLYSLIMVSPSTSQRMSIHFIPFLYYLFYFRRKISAGGLRDTS